MDVSFTPVPTRARRLLVFALAVVGLLAGIDILVVHLTTDPLADVRAYYDAGARLNAGLPLYSTGADTNAPDFYRYPPLLAVVFRPLALLPYPVASAIWAGVVLAAFLFTLWRLGSNASTWLAVGILALPIAWALAVGQAQVVVTALLVVGAPWAVAMAAHLKVFPVLVGVFWVGRRDWPALGRLAGWLLALGLLQLVLEPRGTIAYLSFPDLAQVGEVNNLSPYAISPVLWVALLLSAVIASIALAPTRWGWAAAVLLSVLATPRLLGYQLSTLLAGIRAPHTR